MYSVSDETRKPIFEGVQGENEAREIQFDVTAWVEELGEGVCTATAKRPTDTTPYPVTVTRSGNVVTWKPNSTDTSIEGIGAFQLAFSINDVVAKTRIWNTKIAPSLVGAGDPPDPYDDWIQDLRDIAAETLTYSQNAENSAENAEAWAVGQRGGVDVPSTDPTYENNSKYWAEQSAANQYGAYIVKSASGDIASFSDGADNVPMKSVNVTITPKQSGSGDPSPSNVRPITGWTDADVHVAERNLFAGAVDEMIPLFLPKLTDVVASASTACVIHYYDINGTEIDYWTLNQTQDGRTYRAFRIKSTADCYYVKFTGNATNFQLEKGTTPTAYEAPTTTPVPLGQTVYGGEVDVVSGEGGDAVKMVDMGSLTWTAFANVPNVFYPTLSDNKTKGFIMCDRYKENTTAVATDFIASGEMWQSTSGRIYFKNTNYTTASAFKAAMSGAQFCYELATPTPFTTTPVDVPSLLGTNNVWSDAGDVAVEYRADPTLAYAELQALILENI